MASFNIEAPPGGMAVDCGNVVCLRMLQHGGFNLMSVHLHIELICRHRGTPTNSIIHFGIAQAADADLTLEHLVLSADSVSTMFSKFSPSWHAVDPSRLDFELRNTHFYGTKIPYRNGTCVQGLYSNDLLFQPTWEEHVADFSIPPNIYTATSDFLLLVSKWIEKEHFPAGRKHVLACDAIRSANKVWYGISVRTVMEFFFMAAFYTYIDHGESNL
ncbi:hypothetical protein K438DRAFT_1765986 [Mycena galopus ATCC 62051]|nr:hypothetical protein K438DRAFT_1765986 [Mycena galopus ATCC 62051]